MKYKGIYINSEHDKMPVDESKRYLKYIDVKDNRVLDIGGHCGSFTIRAIEAGAKEVWTYEPLPDSFKLLQKNVKGLPQVQIHNKAVWYEDSEDMDMYVHHKYNAASTIASVTRCYRDIIKVPVVSFKDVLREFKPEVIKMDCEGSEFDLLLNTQLPGCVRQIILEIHLGFKRHRERYNRLVEVFDSWEVVKPPKSNWNICVACWKR